MAYLSPHQPSPTHTTLIVTYRPSRTDQPIYLLASANGWKPQQMLRDYEHAYEDEERAARAGTLGQQYQQEQQLQGQSQSAGERPPLYQATLAVPKDHTTVLYKFRVGDWEWAWDSGAPTEHDGFDGMNNRYDIPHDLPLSPPPEDVLIDSPSFLPADSLPPPSPARRPHAFIPDDIDLTLSTNANGDGYGDGDGTALPSPAASLHDLRQYRVTGYYPALSVMTSQPGEEEGAEDGRTECSGTEIDAPSVSDWEPAGAGDGAAAARALSARSESDYYPGSPTPSYSTGVYAASETADWIMI